MRTLLTALLVTLASTAFCQAIFRQAGLRQYISGGVPSAGAAYFLSDDFDGANGDLSPGWILDGGNIYITNSPVIVGTSSYFAGGSSSTFCWAHTNFTGVSEFWAFFEMQISQLPGARADGVIWYLNAGAAHALTITINDTGTITIFSDASGESTSPALSLNTTYFIWAHYQASTIAEIWISNNGTRDNLGASYHLVQTVNTGTTSPNRIYFIGQNRTPTLNWAIDKLRMSVSQIGDNPS